MGFWRIDWLRMGGDNCRGGFKTRPYVINNDNPMYMIRHYYERIRFDIFVMTWQIIPTCFYNIPKFIQVYFVIYDITKQIGTIPCTHRHKIISIPRIIEIRQSYRFAVVVAE